jgi:hypothetical protein
MADRVLHISWGTTVRGREERALEVFNETMGMYGRMQQDGRIESFDVVLLSPTPGLEGYIEIHGSPDQLAALREDDEYMRAVADAGLVIEDMRIVDGWTNAGVAAQMAIYHAAIAKVPQNA